MRTSMIALVALASLPSFPAQARWTPAWSTSQQPAWSSDFLFPTDIPTDLSNVTIRQTVRLGYGGTKVRLLLSNRYGAHPVKVAGMHVAPSAGGSRIDSAQDLTASFGGKLSTVILPGATLTSDALPLEVKPGDDLAISLRFDEAPRVDSFHWDGRRTSYILAGNQLGSADPVVRATTTRRLFLSAVLVDAPDSRGTVVVMGDSITDGAGARLDGESRWPDFLATRAAPRRIGVINAGVSGARLLGDRMGANALARFDDDVLAHPDVRALIVMLGINDIAWPGTPFSPTEAPMTFDRMVAGYRALIERGHAANIRVIGGTLTPFQGALPGTPLAATYYTPAKDALRRRVNEWIRYSGAFDGVVDFDRLLADRARPGRLAAPFDSGDHLHPGDRGNRAMSAAIDLEKLMAR